SSESFTVKAGTNLNPVKMKNFELYSSPNILDSGTNWIMFECEDGKTGYLPVVDDGMIYDANNNKMYGRNAFDEVPMFG
ncbi:MAG: hypothetical protein K6G26_05275, partial [Lachnospiraceae bacterium]|nr:hypothetical protein [Lachnospiraceae bacterium]